MPKIKVVFRRTSDHPPFFRFSAYSANGRRILSSVPFNRLAKAQSAWQKIRKAILTGGWHWETEP